MFSASFSSWPSFSEEEVESVKSVLLSNKVNYWTGNIGKQFETSFAEYIGCKHAIALSNGTVALELALHGLGLSEGDEVIVTPRTFIASASAIVMCGAAPVFAEIDPDSQNITANTIKSVITKKTKAIIAVHLAGWPCDMDPIIDLANEYKIKVIEDCAQAHGARYKGRSVGSLGHVAAWSFCQDKIMTTGGEGGMVTTNDHKLWSRMWSYKDHGKSWEAVYEREHPPGFRWLHDSFGTNWRMLEMQAAIGLIQLTRMSEWTAQRQHNANTIWRTARQLPGLRVSTIPTHIGHAAYKCYIFVEPEQLKPNWSRDRIMQAINEQGIPCFSGSCSEVYLEKAFDNTNWRPAQSLPIAKELGETSLVFLVHPTLTDDDINLTCQTLRKIMTHATN